MRLRALRSRGSRSEAGLSNAAIADLSRGELSNDLSPGEALAQRLARQLAEARDIAPDLYAEAEQTFDRKTLVDLVALAGNYGLVCGLLNGFANPAPPTPA